MLQMVMVGVCVCACKLHECNVYLCVLFIECKCCHGFVLCKAFISLFHLQLSYFASVTFYLSICLSHAKWSYSILALGFLWKLIKDLYMQTLFICMCEYEREREWVCVCLCVHEDTYFCTRFDLYPTRVENTLIGPSSILDLTTDTNTADAALNYTSCKQRVHTCLDFLATVTKWKSIQSTKPCAISCIHQFSQLGTTENEQVT